MPLDPASIAAAIAIAAAALGPNTDAPPDAAQLINDAAATITEHTQPLPDLVRDLVNATVTEQAAAAVDLLPTPPTPPEPPAEAPAPTPAPWPDTEITPPGEPLSATTIPAAYGGTDGGGVPTVGREGALGSTGSVGYTVPLNYPVAPVAPAGVSFESLSSRNLQIARSIVDEGRRLGIPDRGIQIAIAVGFAESGLRNLANPAVPASLSFINDGLGYDHDSVNPFQQRQSWGTTAELMDPATAASKFYTSLLRVAGWQQMPLTVAAQTVQVSAFPHAYAPFERIAGEVLARLTAHPTLGAA